MCWRSIWRSTESFRAGNAARREIQPSRPKQGEIVFQLGDLVWPKIPSRGRAEVPMRFEIEVELRMALRKAAAGNAIALEFSEGFRGFVCRRKSLRLMKGPSSPGSWLMRIGRAAVRAQWQLGLLPRAIELQMEPAPRPPRWDIWRSTSKRSISRAERDSGIMGHLR